MYDDDDEINIAGLPLLCQHCSRDRFVRRGAPVQDASEHVVYVCAHCGYLHWFHAPAGAALLEDGAEEAAEPHESEPPERPEPSDPTEPGACLACGAAMEAGDRRCPECGLRYVETDGPAAPPPLPERKPPPPPPPDEPEEPLEEEPEYDEEVEPEPEIEPQVDEETCPECDAPRRGRTSICQACGSIFEDA